MGHDTCERHRVLQIKATGRETNGLLNIKNGVCFLFWAFGICGWIGTGRQGANTHPPQGCVVQKFTRVFVFQELLALKATERGRRRGREREKHCGVRALPRRYFSPLLSPARGLWSWSKTNSYWGKDECDFKTRSAQSVAGEAEPSEATATLIPNASSHRPPGSCPAAG